MGNSAVDRVRNQQIPPKGIELDVLGGSFGSFFPFCHLTCSYRGSILLRKLDRESSFSWIERVFV